jgi:phosphoinositide-3-kinase regulatory subunit 4
MLFSQECICDEGRVLVKVYGRRGESSETIQREKAKLEAISGTFGLVKNGNLIPLKVIVTERAAFLVRQYFAHNLFERVGTRPFLTFLEKRWVLFQLLKALDQCHHWGISHGDVTTENVVLTSWLSAYLTDFSPFKPAYLPLEDPSDFTFFYNSSGRTAYIAPERFYSTADTGVSCMLFFAFVFSFCFVFVGSTRVRWLQ